MSAKYRRLADTLISQIRSGERPPGSLMPSARDLAREHGTSTVQRAMDALKAEGWTVGVPGSGTYVADEMPPPPPPRPAPRRAADRLTAVEGDVAALKARFAEHERGHS